MPHPAPAQIVYGSATVIATTFLSLLLVPEASSLAVAFIAGTALLLGVAVALAVQPGRRGARRPGEPEDVSVRARERPRARV